MTLSLSLSFCDREVSSFLWLSFTSLSSFTSSVRALSAAVWLSWCCYSSLISILSLFTSVWSCSVSILILLSHVWSCSLSVLSLLRSVLRLQASSWLS